ncbi:Spy/CpxP family protein refolding chaperone [Halarcobacter sp.]|uniref:Spy/CpxP family protein refolding chaperone n=1 Tax=Halarcobacter sp. TaxID=2321133 RepID=UPI0029F57B47|nr:Spy/CpxP family protein refolding chaperone [Halarcobacter sp.]
MIKLKILTVLCSLFLFTSLYASKHDFDFHEYKKEHIHKNLDYLNLNENQLEKIKKTLIKYRKKYAKYTKKRASKELRLKELFKADNFNEEKYEDILEDILEDEIELEIKVLKKIHSILTPEQREKFSFYLKEWRVE